MQISKKLKNLFIIFFLIFSNISNLVALENKILFKVDDEIITTIDVYEEIKFLKTFNPEVNELKEKEIIEISKNSIVRDKIKQIEIIKYVKEIKIEDDFLLRYIKNKYSNIGLSTIESFENYLKENNLNIKLAKEKIATELIWNDIIFQKFSPQININREMIKKEILTNSKKELQKEFSLSEIVFNITEKSELEKKYNKIILDIEQTGFKNAALIHSVSDTSSNGGFVGWVKEDNLNKTIKSQISNLKIGQYSNAIRTSVGFLIIKIEDIKEYEVKFDLNKKTEEMIRFKTNEQLNQFSNSYFNKIKKDMSFNDF